MNDGIPAPRASRGSEIILNEVGRRFVTGANLTMSDENMAIIASAQENAANYGPDTTNFKVNGPELPETVKGTLVKHST